MFKVQYGATIVKGQELPQAQTLPEPLISFNGKPNHLYTILMVDPDAPQHDWLHWLIVNRTANTQGVTLTSYSPPTPPSGTHRYYLYLCEQTAPLSIKAPKSRGDFNTKAFIQQNGLKILATPYFKVSFDK